PSDPPVARNLPSLDQAMVLTDAVCPSSVAILRWEVPCQSTSVFSPMPEMIGRPGVQSGAVCPPRSNTRGSDSPFFQSVSVVYVNVASVLLSGILAKL